MHVHVQVQAQLQALSAATVAGAADGYQPFEIANGSATLLDEVLASKITGEEDAFSRIGSGVADPTAGGRPDGRWPRRCRCALLQCPAGRNAGSGWRTGCRLR